MKILIITCSPNKSGLTAACGEKARLGVTISGAEATLVRLNDLKVGMCHACNDGWGSCRDQHVCQIKDDFQELHEMMKEAEGLILITPVYWWDMSETAKAFIDRLRRCEGFKKEKQYLVGKPVICIASAGGTGNGFVSCLVTMEKFVDHVKGVKFDFIGVTRRNKDYKLKTIYEASISLVESLKKTIQK